MFSSKLVFLLPLICCLISTGSTKIPEEIREECLNSFPVSQDVLDKAKNGEIAEDDTLKKYFVCVVKKTDVLTEDGLIDVEKVKKFHADDVDDVDTLGEIVEKCNEKKENLEETVFYGVQCFFKNAPENLKFSI